MLPDRFLIDNDHYWKSSPIFIDLAVQIFNPNFINLNITFFFCMFLSKLLLRRRVMPCSIGGLSSCASFKMNYCTNHTECNYIHLNNFKFSVSYSFSSFLSQIAKAVRDCYACPNWPTLNKELWMWLLLDKIPLLQTFSK